MFKKKPYIIAEIGSNHNGSIRKAKEIIDLAKKAGCNAVKFQSFQNDLFCEEFYEKNKDVREQINKYSLTLPEFKTLRKYAKSKKIDFGITIFSNYELSKIKSFKPNFIKIASMDLNNIPLLEDVSKLKVNLIISTGFSNYNEIKEAANVMKKNKKKNVVFLHCVGLYPVKPKLINLNSMEHLKLVTGYNVGWSDHYIGIKASEIAAIKGATVIEKHFTYNKKAKGWDHHISADLKDMKKLLSKIELNSLILGQTKKIISKKETDLSKTMRRSITIKKKLKAKHILKAKDLQFQRPGTGIEPKKIKKIIGRKLKRDLFKGTILRYEYLKN